jgi:hypothetical protein
MEEEIIYDYAKKNNYETVRIKKIGVLSLANLLAIIYAFMGLLSGIFVTLFSFLSLSEGTGIFNLFSFSKFSIIIFPVFYAIIGWLSGIIGAFIYNLAAKITKGVELSS